MTRTSCGNDSPSAVLRGRRLQKRKPDTPRITIRWHPSELLCTRFVLHAPDRSSKRCMPEADLVMKKNGETELARMSRPSLTASP